MQTQGILVLSLPSFLVSSLRACLLAFGLSVSLRVVEAVKTRGSCHVVVNGNGRRRSGAEWAMNRGSSHLKELERSQHATKGCKRWFVVILGAILAEDSIWLLLQDVPVGSSSRGWLSMKPSCQRFCLHPIRRSSVFFDPWKLIWCCQEVVNNGDGMFVARLA